MASLSQPYTKQNERLVFKDPEVEGELKVNVVSEAGAVIHSGVHFEDATTYTQEPTPHTAAVMNHLAQGVWEAYAGMGVSAGQRKETIFNPDGSIEEHMLDDATGQLLATKITVFNTDGSITETFTAGGNTMTKTTIFNPDGTITEVVQ